LENPPDNKVAKGINPKTAKSNDSRPPANQTLVQPTDRGKKTNLALAFKSTLLSSQRTTTHRQPTRIRGLGIGGNCTNLPGEAVVVKTLGQDFLRLLCSDPQHDSSRIFRESRVVRRAARLMPACLPYLLGVAITNQPARVAANNTADHRPTPVTARLAWSEADQRARATVGNPSSTAAERPRSSKPRQTLGQTG
jgi:hypothetical protein